MLEQKHELKTFKEKHFFTVLYNIHKSINKKLLGILADTANLRFKHKGRKHKFKFE